MSGGDARAELGVRPLLASPGSWIPLVRLLELLRICYRGQGGMWSTGGEQSYRRRDLPAAGSSRKSGACRLAVEGSKLGEGLGNGADILRGSLASVVRWGGVRTAVQRSGAGRSRWGRLLGFTAARGVE